MRKDKTNGPPGKRDLFTGENGGKEKINAKKRKGREVRETIQLGLPHPIVKWTIKEEKRGGSEGLGMVLHRQVWGNRRRHM